MRLQAQGVGQQEGLELAAVDLVGIDGFSLHAAVRCVADDQRGLLEQLCRYITRPALADERLQRNVAGQVVLKRTEAEGGMARAAASR